MPVQMKPLVLCDVPVAPAREITARGEMYMTPDVSSKLMDKLNRFYGLHKRPYKTPVVAPHTNFSSTAKSGANHDRSGSVKISQAVFQTHLLI